jgi:hypothetical protein
MRFMKHSIFKTLVGMALASTASMSCGLSTTAPNGTVTSYGAGPKRILFIGNSLTAANDMPFFFAVLAESAKVSPLPTVDVDWAPDFALIDHWNTGGPRGVITQGKYSIVVLQQGPSSVEVNRDTLRLAATLFAPIIRASGGIPAMLAVWPTSDRLADFDRATESYQLAARDIQAAMIPSGEVWRAAWRRNPALPFYSPDGLHPSALGSYAMALSLIGIIYDRSVVGLPSTLRLSTGEQLRVDPAIAALIQESADEANRQFGSKGTP